MTDTVLVTGGAGYVGSHACKEIAAAGFLPVTYDNLGRGNEWAVKWGPLERGDILDRDRVAAVLKAHQPVCVMHFAAYAYVGESVIEPSMYYRNNVGGALVLLEEMFRARIDKFILSSTCATFGIPETLPIPEDYPQAPVNPYGASKLMVERVLADYAQAHDFRPMILRYFNAAGADMDGDIGELHEPETHLIPLAIDAALGTGAALTVFGDDYPTPDGTCVRDYVHVSDLATAHTLTLKALLDGHRGGSYSLGTGTGTSVLEIIDAVERISGRRPAYEMGARRDGDPPELVAQCTRIKDEFGWEPKHSDIDTLIASALAWKQKLVASGR
ncbi:MAG: UDP-glucose 4-epimerase GalE [Alphaproteobacteria bacterium]